LISPVPLILANQQIRDSARIIEIATHKPHGDNGYVFAVEPCPEAKEVLMPSASLFSLAVLDAKTGRELWRIDTGGLIKDAPVTYVFHGRQAVCYNRSGPRPSDF